MEACVVTKANLKEFNKKIKPSLKKVDLVLLPYRACPEISYQKEIEGKTNYIKQILDISKELDCIIVIGTNYDLFGKKYSSILVAEEGQLLGIADSIYPSTDVYKGKELKIFKTKFGNLGIIVNEDLLNKKVGATLKHFGADTFISICEELDLNQINNTIFETGKDLNINIINANSNSCVFYNKITKENDIDFGDYISKNLKH